jgi:2-phosphosulfolactate phosphatase
VKTANTLTVHYLPQFVSESELAGATVVVIDLLRASTTICTALANGAKDVTAFLEVGDLVRAAEVEPDRTELLLGGERGGELIEGFDLGNSPAEYTPDQVFGKRVFFTTTNGTMALGHARLAERVVVGAIVNLSALVEVLQGKQNVHLLCAGTNGHVSRDDRLAAGAIAHELLAKEDRPREMNDSARAVLGEWQELLTTAKVLDRKPSEQLALELRDTPGGKNLLTIGMEEDLPRCAEIDTLSITPTYNPATRRLTAL